MLFGGYCASFQGAVAILRKSTTMGHLKTKAIISDERESAGLKVQDSFWFGFAALAAEPSDHTLLLGVCGEPHSQQVKVGPESGRDSGDGAGQVLTGFSFCK